MAATSLRASPVIRKSPSPLPSQIIAARDALQEFRKCGITEAQELCAEMLHTSHRAFRQWEAGDRGMHAAFFNLLQIKLRAMGIDVAV